jgi:hypothetical protein
LVAATIGQGLLRARAMVVDKKPLFDDLRRVLLAYLGPLLEPERVSRHGRARSPKPASRAPTP